MGIVQSLIGRSSGVVVALSNQTQSLSGQSEMGILFTRAGAASIVRTSGGQIPIPNEWVASGAFPTVGELYDCRFTPGPGVTIRSGVSAPDTWLQISGTGRIFQITTTGYFDIEIRPTGGGANLASSRFTVT